MRKFLIIIALFTTSVVCAQTKGDSIKAEESALLDWLMKVSTKMDTITSSRDIIAKGLKRYKEKIAKEDAERNSFNTPIPKQSDFEDFDDYMEATKKWYDEYNKWYWARRGINF